MNVGEKIDVIRIMPPHALDGVLAVHNKVTTFQLSRFDLWHAVALRHVCGLCMLQEFCLRYKSVKNLGLLYPRNACSQVVVGGDQ